MKKLLVHILCLTLLLAGCTKKKSRPRPGYVLPPDSMALILAEVHVISAVYQHRESRKHHFQKFIAAEQAALFDSVGIPHERFDSSLVFWLQDPKQMLEIYDESMNLLSTRLVKVKQAAPDSAVHHGADQSIRELVEKDKDLMRHKLK